ncbi:hypothetical protein [Paenirhodobacter sp. CAU 1674]|uniref:hypothetical protein n=1 Tax=Paenirhodobacter sp. CAU 1674 TaxID=3032596 RepID=UPI0023DB9B92|nr:hypothetical protein [Paenirhodobacter sp. CAU 1674]MDF2143218.1 hypothetical protein [Paenirhodobacter sp. CAU 1674]
MNRNFNTPAVAADWAQSRETDAAVAMAIHAIADNKRTPEQIWEAPTAVEFENVQMALNEYCINGDIEPGDYCWGQETISVANL